MIFSLLMLLLMSSRSFQKNLTCKSNEPVVSETSSTPEINVQASGFERIGLDVENMKANFVKLERKYKGLKRDLTKLRDVQSNDDDAGSDSSGLNSSCNDGLLYEGACYTIEPGLYIPQLDYDEARVTCMKVGGYLAQIYDLAHQEVLVEFVRSKIDIGITRFWVGMSYDSNAKRLGFRSGDSIPVSDLQWYDGFPMYSDEGMVFQVHLISNRTQGLYNAAAAYPKLHGAICERTL